MTVIFSQAKNSFLKIIVLCPDPVYKVDLLSKVYTIFDVFISLDFIYRKLWIRPMVGQATTNQQNTQYKIKRKTIRMLIVVVVIFCICWMPLNLYHLLTDFHPNTGP